jgi:hypothetical protein
LEEGRHDQMAENVPPTRQRRRFFGGGANCEQRANTEAELKK